jgi:hemerythrin-like domain-containing protein
MLDDHVQGREFVRQISEGLDRLRKGELNGWIQIQKGMKGYGDLLRSHINKENNILFRMADKVMDHREDLLLASEFTKVDQGAHGTSSREFTDRIDVLVARLLQ